MLGQPDRSHLNLANLQGRVIVTDDTDFLIEAAKSTDHPGIVFCRRTSFTQGQIIRFLILLHGVYTPAEMRGRVEYPF